MVQVERGRRSGSESSTPPRRRVLDRTPAVRGAAWSRRTGTPSSLLRATGSGWPWVRLDIEIDLPNQGGAWPILALREGARERTGLILATPGARCGASMAWWSPKRLPFDRDLAQESRLIALECPAGPAGRPQPIWLMRGRLDAALCLDRSTGPVWGQHQPINRGAAANGSCCRSTTCR